MTTDSHVICDWTYFSFYDLTTNYKMQQNSVERLSGQREVMSSNT